VVSQQQDNKNPVVKKDIVLENGFILVVNQKNPHEGTRDPMREAEGLLGGEKKRPVIILKIRPKKRNLMGGLANSPRSSAGTVATGSNMLPTLVQNVSTVTPRLPKKKK